MLVRLKDIDIDKVIENINTGGCFDADQLQDYVQNENKILIGYKEAGLIGLGYAELIDRETSKWSIKIYVKPEERRKGIGKVLHEEVIMQLREKSPNLLIMEFCANNDNPIEFYKKLGYKKWYSFHDMVYRGTIQQNIDIQFVPYTDEYYIQYAKCRQECFYELRKKNDIQPYVAFQLNEEDRANTLKRKDSIHIALVNNQLIASVELMDGYIDRIIVPPAQQGNGFGKKATQYAINEALNQGAKKILLSVLDNNTKALNLYLTLGFEIVKTTYIYRQFEEK